MKPRGLRRQASPARREVQRKETASGADLLHQRRKVAGVGGWSGGAERAVSHFRTSNSEHKRSCHDGCIRIPMVLRGPGFTGDPKPLILPAAGG
ncbi:MAG: hypothetical protein FJ224_10000 [Lentisphaerae bacterium]|nr:hypothetical protein [Lentisphaerota bacterium]